MKRLLILALGMLVVFALASCATPSQAVKETTTELSISKLYTGGHLVIIPIGDETDPNMIAKVIEEFEKKEGAIVTSCNLIAGEMAVDGVYEDVLFVTYVTLDELGSRSNPRD